MLSPDWNNGAALNAGAVTWVNGTAGTTADGKTADNNTVNRDNSLLGTTAGSFVGSGGVTVLGNGDYVVASPDWNDGAALNAGAVTWVNGTTGETTTGSVSEVSMNTSLVGTTSGSLVGSGGVVALAGTSPYSFANYVVESPVWNTGSAAAAGAVTWANGEGTTTGNISANNSLVGTIGTVSPKITVSLDKTAGTFIASFVNGADQLLFATQTNGNVPPVTDAAPVSGVAAGTTTAAKMGIATAATADVDISSSAGPMSNLANQTMLSSQPAAPETVPAIASVASSKPTTGTSAKRCCLRSVRASSTDPYDYVEQRGSNCVRNGLERYAVGRLVQRAREFHLHAWHRDSDLCG